MESVAGAVEGRLQEPPVPKPEGAAMGLGLIGVDGDNVYDSEPTRFDHLASSRMALR